MKSKSDRAQIAENAIFILRIGIAKNDKAKIKVAYSLIEEDEDFTWDDLDLLYLAWENLLDRANDILHS